MPIKYYCAKCKKHITESVFNFDMGKIHDYLCWECRDKVKDFVLGEQDG